MTCLVTICVCSKGFLDFKTSLGINLNREDFNLESLLASNVHMNIHANSLCMHTQDFCLNSEVVCSLVLDARRRRAHNYMY